MKDLTDEFKLSARSTAEVFVLLGQMVDRLKADRRVRFRGKKPTRAAIVNAALLYLDSLPQAQWEQALQLGLTRLEGFLAEDDDPATAAPAAAAADQTPSPPTVAPSSTRGGGRSRPSKQVGLQVDDVSPEEPAAPARSGRKKRG